MVIGYIIGILTIPKYIGQAKALLVSAIIGTIVALGAILSSVHNSNIFSSLFGWLNNFSFIHLPMLPNAIFFLALLGLSNALMWPAIWPLALQDVGKFTKIASALLVMAIIGGALIPPTYIALGQRIGFQQALWIMIPVYLFIIYYAAKGHKLRR